MAINLNRYKKRKEDTAKRGGGGGDFWTTNKDGKNIIRVFSFEHTLTKEDFELNRYDRDDADVGEKVDDIDVFCPVHFIKGVPHNCMIDDCNFCSDAKKSGDKDIGARERYYVNAVVIMESDKLTKDESMKIASLPKTVYDAILGYVSDDDYGVDVLGYDGRDFIIDYDPKSQGSDMYSVKIRDEKKCADLSDIEAEPIDLYAMENLMPGWVKTEDDDKESKGGKESKGKSRREKKKEKEKDADEGEGKDDRASRRKRREEKEDDKKDPDFEIGDILSFEDKELGTITGEFIAVEKDKKGKEWYIIKDKDDNEYEAKLDELYLAEEKKEEKKSSRRRRR